MKSNRGTALLEALLLFPLILLVCLGGTLTVAMVLSEHIQHHLLYETGICHLETGFRSTCERQAEASLRRLLPWHKEADIRIHEDPQTLRILLKTKVDRNSVTLHFPKALR